MATTKKIIKIRWGRIWGKLFRDALIGGAIGSVFLYVGQNADLIQAEFGIPSVQVTAFVALGTAVIRALQDQFQRSGR